LSREIKAGKDWQNQAAFSRRSKEKQPPKSSAEPECDKAEINK
jgi:hypothetical protein